MANSLEVVQRRQKDYLQSDGDISGYEEEFENLFKEMQAFGYGCSAQKMMPYQLSGLCLDP
ncbi:Protein of unknown function [Gryllus bimaculatus]|nr:Protein of unknown function [Gryllus bimaculatus]